MSTPHTSASTPHEAIPAGPLFGPPPRRGPITLLLDFFSSVKLGITLMFILFVYASIGSAGIIYPAIGPGNWNIFDLSLWRHEMMRQWRPFELTEFEWFHTWFFNLNILLICINITVTTLRRIRLNSLNAGVWMIHAGIIILSIGSYIYFGTKFEGDAPVLRRTITINVPGADSPLRLASLPGSAGSLRTDAGEYFFAVEGIDPQWELRSEGDLGKKAYAATIAVQTPTARFMRQLLAGYPQYTEDVIPGKGRVKKLEEFGGMSLVDESLSMSMDIEPQEHLWIKDSAAVYARESGTSRWAMRPIHGLPRYNDYVGDPLTELWPQRLSDRERPIEPDPISIAVQGPMKPEPAAPEADPLAGVDVRVTGYLRYAVLHKDVLPGGPELNPMVDVDLALSGRDPVRNRLFAKDSERRSALSGNLTFDWITDPSELEPYSAMGVRELIIRIPSANIDEKVSFTLRDVLQTPPDAPLIPLGESGFSYRIRRVVDRFPMNDGSALPLLQMDVVTPEGGKMVRWVFEDQARIRDNRETKPEEPHASMEPDPRLTTIYAPGKLLTPLALVAGPAPIGLHLFADNGKGERTHFPLASGQSIEPVPGLTLTVARFFTDAVEAQKPAVIPKNQRDRDSDAGQFFALVRVKLSADGWSDEQWIPFHRYSFESSPDMVNSLSRFEPKPFTLPSGRRIEMIVARERMRLPNPVALEEFSLTTHVGGFTGSVSSIRDWHSILKFKTEDGWSSPVEISTNDPTEFEGLWFFQAFWDAPRQARFEGDVASAGLNFTGLGIGNRRGVYTQLFGCCLSVAGMIYAFYIKPIIRRRRRQQVMADIESGRIGPRSVRAASLEDTPILVGGGPPAIRVHEEKEASR